MYTLETLYLVVVDSFLMTLTAFQVNITNAQLQCYPTV